MQWFDEKRPVIEFTILVIAFVIAVVLMFIFLPRKGDVIRIDCTWSEISPDFSNEMRELCRKERAKKSLTLPK